MLKNSDSFWSSFSRLNHTHLVATSCAFFTMAILISFCHLLRCRPTTQIFSKGQFFFHGATIAISPPAAGSFLKAASSLVRPSSCAFLAFAQHFATTRSITAKGGRAPSRSQRSSVPTQLRTRLSGQLCAEKRRVRPAHRDGRVQSVWRVANCWTHHKSSHVTDGSFGC